MVKLRGNADFPASFWQALDAGALHLDLGVAGQQRLLQRIDASPCQSSCPAGVNVKGYLGLIADGKHREAVELVRRDCPLPGICGRVCTHPCELNCRRGEMDDPLAIRLLKRFVADWELENPGPAVEKVAGTRPESVGIVGAGPAGLAAAFDLAGQGYSVTIYEAEELPGGMLVQCIPAFRLPREIVAGEIAHIEALGVEIRRGVRVGRDIGLDEIRDKHKALILALGTQLGKKMKVPGEDEFKGVLDCVEFLRKANAGEKFKGGKRMLVIGGGMSAMDAARMGRRLGFEEVVVVYRRTRDEMPAVPEEIHEAGLEGVLFEFLAAPTRVLGKKGRVTGLEVGRMELGEPDESGRRRPVPIEGDLFTLDADLIVPAISQAADLDLLPDGMGFKTNSWGTLQAEEGSLATGVEGVFAAGDLVLGPDTVIGAIAQGHMAARSAMAWMEDRPLPQAPPGPLQLGVLPAPPPERRRMPAAELPVEKRDGQQEVELGYDEATAMSEAGRCLRCGPCDECSICAADCRHRVAVLAPTGEHQPLFIRIPDSDPDFPLPLDPEEVTVEWPARREGEKVVERLPSTLASLVCQVDEKLCRGCGDCLAACSYEAIRLIESPGLPTLARVSPEKCKGCGSCVAVCPTQAMTAGFFRHARIRAEIASLLAPAEEVSR